MKNKFHQTCENFFIAENNFCQTKSQSLSSIKILFPRKINSHSEIICCDHLQILVSLRTKGGLERARGRLTERKSIY